VDSVIATKIKAGRLKIIDPENQVHILEGAKAGPNAAIRITDRRLLRRIMVLPDLYLGEGYMDGTLIVEEGTLFAVLDFCAINLMPLPGDGGPIVATPVHQENIISQAQSNVAHHYDLNRQLFELFLDSDLQYSCAYFGKDGDSLEDAQANKRRRLAAKLLLEPGMRVLDIGCGFGGLALELARDHGVEVVGVTLSEEQWTVAQQRAKAAGLDKKVSFKLLDYREENGCYDRIVSVGMFEHVGRRHYDEFFNKIQELLADDGVALLHSIGRMAQPGSALLWINRYIFPGGYTPALSETIAAVERAGLWITDVEILRLHYALTLQEWHRRFQSNRDRAKLLYDERFCRMWEFYLQISEVAFRRLNWMVFQAQITKKVDAVPLTRNYLQE
jgi:cyclopropane-fatty-acyl-phospholipid synthase